MKTILSPFHSKTFFYFEKLFLNSHKFASVIVSNFMYEFRSKYPLYTLLCSHNYKAQNLLVHQF
jgi:arginine/ornithine N-succinyltransferase beta subunit